MNTKNNVNNEGIKKKIFELLLQYPLRINTYERNEIAEAVIQTVRKHDRERLISVFKDMQICDFSEKDDKIFSFQCVEQIIIEVVK